MGGYVASMRDIEYVYNILIGKRKGKTSRGRLWGMYEDNIERNPK
jgi:hypothetical protein